MQCNLKSKCPNKTDPLYNCWDADCDGWMHSKCSDLLLARYEVPATARPSESDKNSSDDAPVVFCKKGCYSKWFAAKKRAEKEAAKASKPPAKKRKLPWEEDGTLEVLMEWLTTEGNYAEYCGSNGNKGKTKTQHHKELAILIKEKVPDSNRTEKDVENKITGLESQFRKACDWANNTGQGVDNPGDFKAAVLKRCPLFDELDPIMGDRPNAKPLYTNEENSDDTLEDDVDGCPVGAAASATAIAHSTNENEDSDEGEKTTPPKKIASTTSSIASSTTSSRKRITVSDNGMRKRGKSNNQVDYILSNFMGDNEEDEEGNGNGPSNTSFKQLRVREVEAKEAEAKARLMEADANSEKARNESEILRIQAKANLLRERKKLADKGISQEDIDALLPLLPK
jgi:hypothetical protein